MNCRGFVGFGTFTPGSGDNGMQQNRREYPTRDGAVSASELDQLLELLLKLDRTVIELSMQLYNVPQRHQIAMREQNRHLHNAVKEGLPAVLSKRAPMSKGQAALR